MRRIYLDYASTTPLDPAVKEAIQPYLEDRFGNSGALHGFGQEALRAVDRSRETVARAIGADFREIIFTGSATEANNTALRGVVKQWKREHEKQKKKNALAPPRIIISSIEHESVLETAKDLAREGVEAAFIWVNRAGIIDLEKFKAALDERTILVSVMYANNEIGSVQPLAEIAAIIQDYKIARLRDYKDNGRLLYPLLHTDAVQAFQYLDSDVGRLGVDLLTLSAHKIYGPKGIGVLYGRNTKAGHTRGYQIKKDYKMSFPEERPMGNEHVIDPVITGGGQEFGLRSGTENVPAIVGCAQAVERAVLLRKNEHTRVQELRNRLLHGIKRVFPKAEANGRAPSLRVPSQADCLSVAFLPNILNVSFPGHRAADLLIAFDALGIAVSAGSACAARSSKPSHVLRAMGFSKKRAQSSIRFSLGRFTKEKDVAETLARLKKVFSFRLTK